MRTGELLKQAVKLEHLSSGEGLFLMENASTADLMLTADEVRKKLHPENKVGWIIDRNVNITNVCYSCCLFCNFFRPENSREAYITSISEYEKKIKETFALGGGQLLLQGGLHPKLGLKFYTELFSKLKNLFPKLKLHALSPPELVFVSKLEGISYRETLEQLIESGLDSLPGAGAEILSNRVRKIISKNKCTSDEWLDVMRTAHKLGLTTSATMMFGHIETHKERIDHLIAIRNVQNEKPADALGFISFIPWPFQDEDTILKKRFGIKNKISSDEYIRLIALSRIMLPNIPNIQASWLTVGKETAQICLHGGANDFGSIMIEENVVSAAGAENTFNAEGIQSAIREAGFEPYQRNQQFEAVNGIRLK